MSQDLSPGAAIQVIGSTPSLATAGASYANTTGTITTTTSTITTGNIGAAGNVTAYIYGTHAGVTAVFEISPDNTNWFPVSMNREDNGWADTTSGPLPANASRAWTMGAPGLNFFRVRATAWTSGTANVVIVAGTYPFEPLVAIRPRQVATYGAGYRLAAATAGFTPLVWLAVANADKQLATIYHTAASTKTVRLRKVALFWSQTSGAIEFELRRLSATTAPATGNPAITPGAWDSSDPAAEATCLALPTTAGSYTAADSPLTGGFVFQVGTFASPTNVLGSAGQELILYDARHLSEEKPLTMRAGVAEGFAVIGRNNAAQTTNFRVHIEFTEENP